jgi:hypothetical protein
VGEESAKSGFETCTTRSLALPDDKDFPAETLEFIESAAVSRLVTVELLEPIGGLWDTH